MEIDRWDLKIFIKNCYFVRLSFTDNSAGEQLETKTPAFYYLAIIIIRFFLPCFLVKNPRCPVTQCFIILKLGETKLLFGGKALCSIYDPYMTCIYMCTCQKAITNSITCIQYYTHTCTGHVEGCGSGVWFGGVVRDVSQGCMSFCLSFLFCIIIIQPAFNNFCIFCVFSF